MYVPTRSLFGAEKLNRLHVQIILEIKVLVMNSNGSSKNISKSRVSSNYNIFEIVQNNFSLSRKWVIRQLINIYCVKIIN